MTVTLLISSIKRTLTRVKTECTPLPRTSRILSLRGMMIFIIQEQTKELSVSPFFLPIHPLITIGGNQYTYMGNAHNKAITQGNSVEESIVKIIQNQEDQRCPIEFTNILSRAKVVEMKGIRPSEKCRSFTGLY